MRYLMRFVPLAVAAGVAAALAPAPAFAQFGKLLKKAKDAATGSPSGAAPTVRYDETMLELTGERLDRIVASLMAKAHTLETADGKGIVELNREREKALAGLSTPDAAHEAERSAYQNAMDRRNECMRQALDELDRSRQSEMGSKAMDPAFQQQLMERSRQVMLALQRGDTAEAKRLQEQLTAPYASAARADSAQAERRCGPAPAKPRFMVEDDSLSQLSRVLFDRIRASELLADSVALERSGLDRRQLGMALERIFLYLGYIHARGRPEDGFSRTELAALEAHREALKHALDAIDHMGGRADLQ